MKSIKERLLEKFHDITYRHTYVEEFTDAYIATQIKVLREQRDWNQTVLAEKAGMHQSQIVTYEDVNNSSWTLRTLKKIAKAFDLVLVVRFESFGKVLPDIGHLEREHLTRESFTDDPVFNGSPQLLNLFQGAPKQKVATVLNVRQVHSSGRYWI